MNSAPALQSIAFISAAEFDQLGICGGALVVNGMGRPMEFHCTSPVTATRTQEILFGKTLDTYLYCEQIARALLDEMKANPDVIVIRQQQLIDITSLTETPVFLMQGPEDPPWTEQDVNTTAAFEVGGKTFFILSTHHDNNGAQQILERFHHVLPVDEPFERITQALDEAHAVSR